MRKFFLFIVSLWVGLAYAQKQPDSSAENQYGKVISIGKAEFLDKVYDYEKNPQQWTYKGSKPAIIDFYADWCGPCRMLSPILKSMAEKYKDEIVIYKVNTDKEQELAAAFGITSLPTLLFIPLDENPQIAQGALPKDVLEKGINEVLLKKEN